MLLPDLWKLLATHHDLCLWQFLTTAWKIKLLNNKVTSIFNCSQPDQDFANKISEQTFFICTFSVWGNIINNFL